MERSSPEDSLQNTRFREVSKHNKIMTNLVSVAYRGAYMYEHEREEGILFSPDVNDTRDSGRSQEEIFDCLLQMTYFSYDCCIPSFWSLTLPGVGTAQGLPGVFDRCYERLCVFDKAAICCRCHVRPHML